MHFIPVIALLFALSCYPSPGSSPELFVPTCVYEIPGPGSACACGAAELKEMAIYPPVLGDSRRSDDPPAMAYLQRCARPVAKLPGGKPINTPPGSESNRCAACEFTVAGAARALPEGCDWL